MKTKLHYYRFGLDNAEELKKYRELQKKLKAQGLKCFDSICSNHYDWYKKTIKPLDGKEITLETDFLFNNQWNTERTETSKSGLRVFDWAEAIYHNPDVKEGMYLDQTPEMAEIRRNTLKCQYCGKHYQAAQGHVFCDACLDSEYLEEKQLHLLRLLPVDESKKGSALTDAERANLLPQYIKRQTTGADSRNANKLKRQRETIKSEQEETIRNAMTKRDGLLWLMDHDISIDNVIYYSHTKRFCFGWRSPIEPPVKSALLDLLCEFPFDYDIKE